MDALLRLVFPVVVRIRISDGKITADPDVLEEQFGVPISSLRDLRGFEPPGLS